MNRVFAAAIALLVLGVNAQADVFNMGPGLTNLEMVMVGDLGNAPDTRYATPGYGSVSYAYRIGRYEVTAAQYTEFLNAKAKTDPYGLYNSYMADTTNYQFGGCNIQRNGTSGNYSYTVADDWANRPVNYVSYWDALRFANWLHNGQGNGDTETGAYTLNGYNGQDGRTIGRNAGWQWAVTSEDEWHKAAYYKGGGTNAGYWLYPTRSNTLPGRDTDDASGNNANYYDLDATNDYTIGSPYYRTNVGEFDNSDSPYGTFDQAGNVYEWNEAVIAGDTYRGLRGGSYYSFGDQFLATGRTSSDPTNEHSYVGFRVAAAVPEPSSLIALAGGLVSLIGLRRRRA